MRASFLKDLYDDNDVVRPDEILRLTPGTPEFAVLDATARRERRASRALADFKRMNSAVQATRATDYDLPAFSDDVIRGLRSFLELDPRSQNYIMNDDAASQDRAAIYVWLRQVALSNPAARDQSADRPLLTRQNFEADLARDLHAIAARCGDVDPELTVLETRAAVSVSARANRQLGPTELQRMKKHWSVLGSEPQIDKDGRSVTCALNGKASVIVTSNAIYFSDMSTADERQRFEATRLAVLHAREHWGARLRIDSYVPDFTLRTIAFSELLGVEVAGDHLAIPREQIDAFKTELRTLYPEGLLAPRKRAAATEPSRPGVIRQLFRGMLPGSTR